MPAHIINEGIVSGGMFIAIGESIIARVAALGGYISFSLTGRPKTPYEQVPVHAQSAPDRRFAKFRENTDIVPESQSI